VVKEARRNGKVGDSADGARPPAEDERQRQIMSAQFIRVYSHTKGTEELLNVGMIWKIEVKYPARLDPHSAPNDPNAERSYKLFIGSEEHLVKSDRSSPATKIIEEIYNSAL
jgi:hypothetical protein